jgi:hypothetical protein
VHSRTTEFPTSVPAGTLAVVRSLLVLQCSTEQNALHTLICVILLHHAESTPLPRREPCTRQGCSRRA